MEFITLQRMVQEEPDELVADVHKKVDGQSEVGAAYRTGISLLTRGPTTQCTTPSNSVPFLLFVPTYKQGYAEHGLRCVRGLPNPVHQDGSSMDPTAHDEETDTNFCRQNRGASSQVKGQIATKRRRATNWSAYVKMTLQLHVKLTSIHCDCPCRPCFPLSLAVNSILISDVS